MDAPRFPLMRLPLTCSQNVLRILTPIQLFEISLVSKKAKGLAQSLRIKASEFIVRIDTSFTIRLKFYHRVLCFRDLLNYEDIPYAQYSNVMDGKTFINHLKFIFNTEKIKVDFTSNIEFGFDNRFLFDHGYGVNNPRFDFEMLLKGRRDIEKVYLMTDDQEENQRILNYIKPPMVFMGKIVSKEILIQNFHSFFVRRWTTFSLNKLLLMNSRHFQAVCRTVPAKQANRFLKLWMRGSNLQLESLIIRFRQGDFAKEVLDGLKAMRNEELKYFKSAERICKVDGGMNIFRFDGTMATIIASKGRLSSRFEIFVWHDHCIAKETEQIFDFKPTLASMDAPRFPLLRLPVACSKNVLRILTAVELFGISLASKKTKGLAQCLGIKASEFILRMDTSFTIRLKFRHRVLCVRYLISYEDIPYAQYSNVMDGKTFINHLKFTFNTEKIKVDFEFGFNNRNMFNPGYGVNNPRFDLEMLLKGRRDIEKVYLMTDDQEEHRRILNIMKPSIVTFYNTLKLRDILFQNFDYLRANHMTISLEDLLSMNIRNFSTGCPMFSRKSLNRFLKLWMRGSNLQLESLKLRFSIDGFSTTEDIFDRLKTTRNNTVRYFKSAIETSKITSGTDILRFDGTKSTIIVHIRGWRILEFEMFVWHDHCVANETDFKRYLSIIKTF